MAYGDRRAERVRLETRYPVNLMGVDGTWRRSCILLDVSQSGARLEVDGTLDVLKAQEFFLVLSSRGLAFRRCESHPLRSGSRVLRLVHDTPLASAVSSEAWMVAGNAAQSRYKPFRHHLAVC